jgi:deazaflavin-dependent oxidoreductase (nitroreductase family)
MPQGNSVVLTILRSPVHRLLSGMAIELQYTGRRSGRRFSVPVQYVQDGGRLVIVPQDADTKTWWRNFRTAQPVTVRLKGRLYDGTARVVRPEDPEWQDDQRLYVARWKRLAGRVTGPLVEIRLTDERGESARPVRG